MSCPEKDATYYAHWVSANDDRTVEITDIRAGNAGNKDKVRISKDESENTVTVTFTLSKWFGQEVAFVNKKGEFKEEIDVGRSSEEGS